jgi:gamma-glutamylcysteine synthetase
MKQNRSLKLKPSWQNTLESLSRPEFSAALKGIRRGIEKESLRVNDDSRLASTGHPAPLGSALTHAWITTDYAEALMEFITPVGSEAEETKSPTPSLGFACSQSLAGTPCIQFPPIYFFLRKQSP